MKVGVLGTGQVGQTIASKLVSLGHDVVMGSRIAGNPKALAWAKSTGGRAHVGTFEEAAKHGELVFHCGNGSAALELLQLATAEALAGKVLVDVSNPLDTSNGMPPTLTVANTDSLGEQIQRAFPRTRVVKSLNTVNHGVMVDPAKLVGDHVMFVCGDDADAKALVTKLLVDEFGWPSVLDLGKITSSRATEAYVTLWVRLWGALGTGDFNVAIVRGR